jgi:hypothetical protein
MSTVNQESTCLSGWCYSEFWIPGSIYLNSNIELDWSEYHTIFTADHAAIFDINGATLDDYQEIYFSALGGSVTLTSDLDYSNDSLYLLTGTFNTNGYTLNLYDYIGDEGQYDNVGTIQLSNSIINIGNDWLTGSQMVDAGTSTINMLNDNTDFEGGYTIDYNIVERTFYDLNLIGNNIDVWGKNIFNTITIQSGNTGKFDYDLAGVGYEQTINNIVANGAYIRSCSSTDKQQYFLKSSGTVIVTNADIKDSNAGGGATFYAFNSVDSGNNTGWIFSTVLTQKYNTGTEGVLTIAPNGGTSINGILNFTNLLTTSKIFTA